MRSRLIKFVAVYAACCLLSLLTTVLVDRIFIRFFFWQGGHADEPVMGFLVSIHTLFFFPWTMILSFATDHPHRWSLEVNFARWIVCTLTWGLVLYFSTGCSRGLKELFPPNSPSRNSRLKPRRLPELNRQNSVADTLPCQVEFSLNIETVLGV